APVFSELLYQSIELLERYSVELAIDLAHRLNVVDHLSQWRSVDDLCGLLSFQPSFKFAVHWILERLVQIDSANAATLDLLDHAASLYPAVADGRQSGDRNLLGPQGVPLWLNYFRNDNLTYAVNNWVGASLAAKRISNRRAVQILEVGAGPGSASEILLRVLGERGLLPRIKRYLITEPNAFFLRYGQRKIAKQYPDLPLEWGALNLDSPWHTQGIKPGEFDLV